MQIHTTRRPYTGLICIVCFLMIPINPKWQALVDVFLDTNSQINLSAIRDAEGVYVKHVLDSLELLHITNPDVQTKIADIGTGGGFPLLPLAMSWPKVSFVGIDSVNKKLQAIGSMCEQLGIKNVRLLWKRIEEVEQKFDIVTARAVAHVEKLIPWAQHLLKPGSKLMLYKEDKEEEKAVMMKMLGSYKLKLVKEHKYSLFEGDIRRVIYVLEKAKS